MKMKKEYKVPFYTFSYSKHYYLTHPWHIFKSLWITLKNAIMRVKYCFDWPALWNMDDFLAHIIPNMLDELVDRGSSWNEALWSNPEDQKAEFHILAKTIRAATMPALLPEEQAVFNEFLIKFFRGDIAEPIKHTPAAQIYTLSLEEYEDIQAHKDIFRSEYAQSIILKKALTRFVEMWCAGALWD